MCFFFFHFFLWPFDVCSRQIKKKKKLFYLIPNAVKKETPNVPCGIDHNCNEVTVFFIIIIVCTIFFYYFNRKYLTVVPLT